MKNLPSISSTQQQQVIDETRRYIDLGNHLMASEYPHIPVKFDLRGKAAGMYKVNRDGPHIRYNPWLFARYYAENFNTTIPHEVAHYLVCQKHHNRIRPHGQEWRSLMQAFSANDSRTVDFDMSGIPVRRYRQYAYACQCRQHALTSRRHQRVVRRQAKYYCRYCGVVIRQVAEDIENI